jgi:protein gp37
VAENTKIEWATHTFNPWIGCSKVSRACDFCYAEELMDTRYGRVEWGGDRVRTAASTWMQPFKWNRMAEAKGERATVFCLSLGDIWDKEVDPRWRHDLFAVIARTPWLTWLLLSKRIGNAEKMCDPMAGIPCLPSNAALGATMVNQEEWDRDSPKLFQATKNLGAAFSFASVEPMLGPIKVGDGIPDWVIVGGESGPGARPMHPDWARSLRDQCAAAGVPFLFKQWGEWLPKSSVDIYCHGPDKNQREHPKSEGLSILKDGRVCVRDFSVAEHAKRIASGKASNSRAVEVDRAALAEFHATLDLTEGPENPLGYQWLYRVGKKAAGRLLDGVQHDGFPA